MNSSAVAAAPIHTSRQPILTSGRTLKIIAKSRVVKAKETTKVSPSVSTLAAGSRPVAQVLTAVTAVATTSEMSSRKPIPNTMPKESMRVLTKPQIPAPGLGSTFQMRSRELWSCTKTPVAPNRMVTTPMTVASAPEPCLPALAIIAWIACPPCWPTIPCNWLTSCPWTASRPQTRPATPITISSSGASEKIA